jgi:hypothetical protein
MKTNKKPGKSIPGFPFMWVVVLGYFNSFSLLA